MPRAALYARYSSDTQRDASIEDQLRQCREYAARQGWTVVAFYSERAISGASLIRSGIQDLLADAPAGRFDIVLSEALDRISRDQEDVAAVFKRLRFASVSIVTLLDLRIVSDALWAAAKARQDELTALYQAQIEASRAATRHSVAARGLNATHRPRTLLSGLLYCGCCGGSYARRGQDRYACTRHVLSAGCDNARTIDRKVLEARVLAGLRDRLMAPEVATEVMRAYAEETNRLNRERRTSGAATSPTPSGPSRRSSAPSSRAGSIAPCSTG